MFINGKLEANVKGFTNKYEALPIAADKRTVLKVGENLMAVHCSQTNGGQFIDVHLVDSDKCQFCRSRHIGKLTKIVT